MSRIGLNIMKMTHDDKFISAATGQLYSICQTPPGRKDTDRGRGGQHHLNLGSGCSELRAPLSFPVIFFKRLIASNVPEYFNLFGRKN